MSSSLLRDDLIQYIKTHYKGSRMVLAGAGGIDHGVLCKLATDHFGKISNVYENEVPKDLPCRYTGKELFQQNIKGNLSS